jgi:cytochrome c oxidase subunit IV
MSSVQHKEHHHHHLMSLKTHINVFVALLILTVVTVAASLVDFGAMNTVIAFLIATIKATLVMGWFMHLKYDGVMNRIIFATGFFFLFVLAIICLLDIYTRINPR